MAKLSTPGRFIAESSGISAGEQYGKHASDGRRPRGVLSGAFEVLEALAEADDGLGLTALARASGLAKTSAHRLAEQLVALGAVQRAEQRYYIGPRIGHIGHRWQPDPRLRHAAQTPVHALAVQAQATASLRILHDDRLWVICATVPQGHAYLPCPAEQELTARTATGRVLYAAGETGEGGLPDCWTVREWQQLRDSIRDLHATVVDHQEAFSGICCVSAPVWWPDGTCAGALTVLRHESEPAANLAEWVVRAARRISAQLQ